jgi:hypothetical protein
MTYYFLVLPASWDNNAAFCHRSDLQYPHAIVFTGVFRKIEPNDCQITHIGKGSPDEGSPAARQGCSISSLRIGEGISGRTKYLRVGSIS